MVEEAVEEAAERLERIWKIQAITPGHPIQGTMTLTMILLASHLVTIVRILMSISIYSCSKMPCV